MTSPTTMGRKPFTIVELEQPRCALRFGVGACTATGTKCYNTLGTCGDVANYDGTGSVKWRFMDTRPGVFDLGDYSDADNPEVDPIPCSLSVSTASGQINAGANLEGRSPLGVTGRVSVRIGAIQWNDRVGDYYLTDRTGYVSGKAPPMRGNFFALWTARNLLFNDMYLRIYDGYEGQALSQMRQRLYILEKVDGPNAGGETTLTGLDPTRLASDKRALFPPVSDLDLVGDITDEQTEIRLFGTEGDLTKDLGNTGTDRYLSIDKELVKYTGYTSEGDGVYLLSGVERGALDTVADEHEDGDKVQRAGRYEKLQFWLALQDLFENHTEMSSDFIPIDDWNAEGNEYLPTYRTTRTVVRPTQVSTLAGQIVQQGLFYIWWDEYGQEIKLLAVRAPTETPAVLTDEANLIKGTTLMRDPSVRLSQVTVYYDLIDTFDSETSETNYRRRYTHIDGDNQGEERGQIIFAPWISNRTQAAQLATRLVIRYKGVPKFLSIQVDAKDRDVVVGSVADVETAAIVDSEGNAERTRWQVISAKEVKAGQTYMLDLQTYEFLGRFGRYMADGSPDYSAATETQRETGAFYAGDDGLMGDGTEGYQYQ